MTPTIIRYHQYKSKFAVALTIMDGQDFDIFFQMYETKSDGYTYLMSSSCYATEREASAVVEAWAEQTAGKVT